MEIFLELPLDRCPHCGRANPLLARLWNNDNNALVRGDGGVPWFWSIFACRSCSGVVSARGQIIAAKVIAGKPVFGLRVDALFPNLEQVDNVVPPEAARFLKQALETKHAPDACVLMCAASIDAMLKEKDLVKGSLSARLNEALAKQLIPKALSEWGHRVRLDANGSRHADDKIVPLNSEDAERSIGFARAMAEYLYVLPATMPHAASEASTS